MVKSMIDENLTDKLYEQIPALMQEENVPGLSLCLIRDTELFWGGTFGVRSSESQEPVTEDTLFEVASLSKPVFAYAVLKLCETEVLDLDTPLENYLTKPYLPKEPRLKILTTRHVLSHTTGFPNWRPEGKELEMYFTPGERFSYSGEGYMYLQTVVEQITGQDPAGFMDANVLKPLGMENSHFVLTEMIDLPIAIGHDEKGEAKEKYLWKEMYAAASLHCNTKDYGRFLCAVLQPAPNNSSHLAPATIKEMLTPQIQVNDSAPWDDDWPKPKIQINDQVAWGLGWGIQHTTTGDAIWHWGDNGNYRAFVVGYPEEGDGIVILTNGRKGQMVINHILRDFIGGEYPGLDWLYG